MRTFQPIAAMLLLFLCGASSFVLPAPPSTRVVPTTAGARSVAAEHVHVRTSCGVMSAPPVASNGAMTTVARAAFGDGKGEEDGEVEEKSGGTEPK